jgi:hypothetical protein
MKYSRSFRNSILKKVLPPSNRSVYSGAKDRDGKTIKTGTTGWCFGGYLE